MSLDQVIRMIQRDINILICSGHINAYDYYYEEYKSALEDLDYFKKIQIGIFSKAISLVFNGDKQEINRFFSEKDNYG